MLRYFSPLLALLFSVFTTTDHARADDAQERRDAITVRAVERMDGFDYRSNPKVFAAIQRHTERMKGTSEYFSLLKKFPPSDLIEKLLSLVVESDNRSIAVEAAQLLGDIDDGPKSLRSLLASDSIDEALRTAEILGLLHNARSINMLRDTLISEKRNPMVRQAATKGLARDLAGQKALLELAKKNAIPGDMRLLTGGLLAASKNKDVRSEAAKRLPLPAQKDAKPLPPIHELASKKGDVGNGVKLFRSVATCSNCHIVGGFGKNVGPDLSEIGSKLSREAMLTAVLDPSAGISHNFENYQVLTLDGQVITGLKMSETANEITIRTSEAIDRKIKQTDIEEIRKSEKSIMPENLHHTVDQQGLVDIIEYMTTLKKKAS